MDTRKTLAKAENKCPKLLSEIKQDLATTPDVEEFVYLASGVTFIPQLPNRFFVYKEEDHKDLLLQLSYLEGCDLIKDISTDNLRRYKFEDALMKEFGKTKSKPTLAKPTPMHTKSKKQSSLALIFILGLLTLIVGSGLAFIYWNSSLEEIENRFDRKVEFLDNKIKNLQPEKEFIPVGIKIPLSTRNKINDIHSRLDEILNTIKEIHSDLDKHRKKRNEGTFYRVPSYKSPLKK